MYTNIGVLLIMFSIPARLQRLGNDSNTKDKPGYYYKVNGSYQSKNIPIPTTSLASLLQRVFWQ